MNFSYFLFLKPILTTLIVPPAGPLLLVFIGLLFQYRRNKLFKRASLTLIFTGSLSLWILSCQGTAVWLSQTLLPQFTPVTISDLKDEKVQAILVLGGGTDSFSPEYGGPELLPAAYDRLRYAVFLSKFSGLPIVYSGGKGWGDPSNSPSEAEVAQTTLKRDWNLELKYAETKSRDTRENANLSFALLSSEGVKRIALVTHATHMPRANRNFNEAGFKVIPAPMGFVTHSTSPVLDSLPSEGGLQDSRWILKEWLGLLLT